MQTLLVKLEASLEIRRLVFGVVQGILPLLLIIVLSYYKIDKGNISNILSEYSLISTSALLLIVVSILVALVLLRCHYVITVVGTPIYPILGIPGSSKIVAKLNIAGVSANLYYFVMVTYSMGLMMFLWYQCESIENIIAYIVFSAFIFFFPFVVVHDLARTSDIESTIRNTVATINTSRETSDLIQEHSRTSLRHTVADVITVVIFALAVYAGVMSSVEELDNFIGIEAICIGRNNKHAGAMFLLYCLSALLVSNLILIRLRLAYEEFSYRLILDPIPLSKSWVGRRVTDVVLALYLLLSVLSAQILYLLARPMYSHTASVGLCILLFSVFIVWYTFVTRKYFYKQRAVESGFNYDRH